MYVRVKHTKFHHPKTKIILPRAQRVDRTGLLYRVDSRVGRFCTFCRILCNCSVFEIPSFGLLGGRGSLWLPIPRLVFLLFILYHLPFISYYNPANEEKTVCPAVPLLGGGRNDRGREKKLILLLCFRALSKPPVSFYCGYCNAGLYIQYKS